LALRTFPPTLRRSVPAFRGSGESIGIPSASNRLARSSLSIEKTHADHLVSKSSCLRSNPTPLLTPWQANSGGTSNSFASVQAHLSSRSVCPFPFFLMTRLPKLNWPPSFSEESPRAVARSFLAFNILEPSSHINRLPFFGPRHRGRTNPLSDAGDFASYLFARCF